MQSKLQQEGFYKAEIDGLSGPSMRNAIKTYATFHSIEDSFKAVKSHMIQDTVRRRRTPTDIEVQSSRELMNETLRDGPSAIYRDEFALETKKGVLVCGRVNGKNAYGAYVGFKSYSITFSKLTLTETTLFPLGDPEFELAELFCLLGTSFGMAVIEKSAA
jgi:peptidoglycan hydrolase-like protein with peptidoglycan-binding domain